MYIIATLTCGENFIPGNNKFLSFLTFTYMKKEVSEKTACKKKKKVCNNKITNSGRNLKMNKVKQKFWHFFQNQRNRSKFNAFSHKELWLFS